MIRFFVVCVLIFNFVTSASFAKSVPTEVELTYQVIVNGKSMTDGPKLMLLAGESASRSWTETNSKKLLPQIAQEINYIDFPAQETFQVARFADGKMINTSSKFSEYPPLTETGETAKILGYPCKHVKTSLRSNSIDIWYTTDLNVKGTPSMAYGIPDGLVLKIVRNGNYEMVATDLKKLKPKETMAIIPEDKGIGMDLPQYRHEITEGLITTVNIFTDEQISFGNEIHNPVDTTTEKAFKYSSGTVIVKKVKLPVVPDDTQLFVELYQRSNGDAYDRTGSVFVIPQDKEISFLDGLRKGIKTLPGFVGRDGKTYNGDMNTSNFSPLIEIMRFFTPFGIGAFNNQVKVYGQQWEDSTYYKMEATELLPVLQGERWIGVFIGNYDKGGHKVSLKFKYYPGSREISDRPAKKYWIKPLFNTVNIMEMSGQEYGTMFGTDSLKVGFRVPEGVKNVEMRYITTGHGGWGGGDEYNQRVNTVLLDGNILFQYAPWRSDCATFRKFNPASGNSWNGITSSDGSRSGWCPGTATNPTFFPVTNLSPGEHHITVAIPMGKREGGSFSAWNVSGVLIGEFEE
jgi:hypothetical protein